MLPFFLPLLGLLVIAIQPSETRGINTNSVIRNYTIVNLTGKKLLFELTTGDNDSAVFRSCKLKDKQLCHMTAPDESLTTHFFSSTDGDGGWPDRDERYNKKNYLALVVDIEQARDQNVFIVNGGGTTVLSAWSCEGQWNYPLFAREVPRWLKGHAEFVSFFCAFNWTNCEKERKPGKYDFSPPDKLERIEDDESD